MDIARTPCHISHQQDRDPRPPGEWTPEEQWARWEAWERLLLAASIVSLVSWLYKARGLTGWTLSRWLAVPALLLAGLACLIGPGHLFPKHPLQGPHLVRLSAHHALTALDLPGLACAGAAIALAIHLVHEQARARDSPRSTDVRTRV